MDDFRLKRAQLRVSQDAAVVHEVQAKRDKLPKPRTITEVSAERRSEKELEKDAPTTGYPELDNIIRGFIPGHLYTLTGSTNVGKTSLACNFAVRISKQGKKVLYFALEPENMVVDYIASVRFNKRFEDLLPEEVEYDDGNIHIYGKEEVQTIDDVVKIIESLDRYDLVIIDHIGYFVSNNANWVQDQSNAIKRLVGIAKAKRCAIMLIAHLRKRQQNTKKSYVPTSDDISGSGAFQQDSTEVMIVVRQVKDPEGGGLEFTPDGILYVTKTKAGPNGSMHLIFSERKANINSDQELMRLTGYEKVQYKESDKEEKW